MAETSRIYEYWINLKPLGSRSKTELNTILNRYIGIGPVKKNSRC